MPSERYYAAYGVVWRELTGEGVPKEGIKTEVAVAISQPSEVMHYAVAARIAEALNELNAKEGVDYFNARNKRLETVIEVGKDIMKQPGAFKEKDHV